MEHVSNQDIFIKMETKKTPQFLGYIMRKGVLRNFNTLRAYRRQKHGERGHLPDEFA